MNYSDIVNKGKFDIFMDMKAQLPNYVRDTLFRQFEKGERDRAKIKTIEDINARREYVRKLFFDGNGTLPEMGWPLNPKTCGVIEENNLAIEKVVFESEEGFYITANLYLPNISAKAPAIVFYCGHLERAKADPEYQRVCRILASYGFVVLCVDPIGQGERLSYYNSEKGEADVAWGTREHSYSGGQCWFTGRGLASYFARDCIKAVDYLSSRPEVDAQRIGVTGNSGGGLQTSIMMLLDDRIKAAAPGTFITGQWEAFETGMAFDAEQVWPNIFEGGFDREDFFIVMAPRPTLILAVEYDFFPIEGTRRIFENSKRFYEIAGAPQNIELFEDRTHHNYTENMAHKAAEFFSRHLGEKKVQIQMDTIEPSVLECTSTGQLLGDLPDCSFVFSENLKYAKTLAEESRHNTEWLKSCVIKDREARKTNIRITANFEEDSFCAKTAIWHSHDGLFNAGTMFYPKDLKYEKPSAVICIWDGGQDEIDKHSEVISDILQSGRAAIVADLTAMGKIQPVSHNDRDIYGHKGYIKKLCEDLYMAGDSLCAMRVYGILRCIDAFSEGGFINAEQVELFGAGRYGLYVKLAKAVDGRIKEINLENVPSVLEDILSNKLYGDSDIAAIAIPGLLKHFNIDNY